SQPSFAGQPLFAAKNPVRTIRDTTLARSTLSERYIEFRNGDRLPGRVITHVDAGGELGGPAHLLGTPAHLIIDADRHLALPELLLCDRVRVLPTCVAGIVNGRLAGRDPLPHTVELAHGGREAFRAHKWRSGSLELLTDAGIVHPPLDELVAIDLAPVGAC